MVGYSTNLVLYLLLKSRFLILNIFMFNFFQKNKAKYISIGFNYCVSNIELPLNEINNGIEMYNNFKGKVFTKEEINKISELIDGDAFETFLFVDLNEYRIKYSEKLSINIKGEYKWIDSKGISEDNLERMFLEKLKNNRLYTMSEIQKLSEEIGCSVSDRNNFTYLIICEHVFNNEIIFKTIKQA